MAEQTWKWRTPSWVPTHTQRYVDDPEGAHMWDSTKAGGPGELPTLLLDTRGRRTGERRLSPVLYGRAGDAWVIIASKGGYPDHPHWYLNLVDHPECEIQVGAEHHHVKARTAEGEERAALWASMLAMYPPYADYEARTDRQIPVVVLEEAASA